MMQRIESISTCEKLTSTCSIISSKNKLALDGIETTVQLAALKLESHGVLK